MTRASLPGARGPAAYSCKSGCEARRGDGFGLRPAPGAGRRDAACLVSGCGAIFHDGDPPNGIARAAGVADGQSSRGVAGREDDDAAAGRVGIVQ